MTRTNCIKLHLNNAMEKLDRLKTSSVEMEAWCCGVLADLIKAQDCVEDVCDLLEDMMKRVEGRGY